MDPGRPRAEGRGRRRLGTGCRSEPSGLCTALCSRAGHKYLRFLRPIPRSPGSPTSSVHKAAPLVLGWGSKVALRTRLVSILECTSLLWVGLPASHGHLYPLVTAHSPASISHLLGAGSELHTHPWGTSYAACEATEGSLSQMQWGSWPGCREGVTHPRSNLGDKHPVPLLLRGSVHTPVLRCHLTVLGVQPK